MRRNGSTVQITRRGLLKTGAGVALGGMFAGSDLARAAEKSAKPSIYEAIGVKPVINAQGTMTYLGGSLMPPEVTAAWLEASNHFVNMHELIDKAGARIAQLIGVEAAMVSTGASGALFLGTVAAVLRGHTEAAEQLPDTSGLRN
jgi:L-seryl-tRNA(Ser) seleniumtransferase